MSRFVAICLTLSTLSLAACGTVLQVESAAPYEPETAPIGAEEPDRFWWQLRFKLTWPEGEVPEFSRHLLIAEQLLLPTIIEHQGQIPLWRFHRRAGRTPSGHQFSLIFYSDTITATQIREAIKSDPLTAWLTDNELIEKVRFERSNTEELDRLERASDPEWPMAIQRSWPYFIMGASQAWLLLVQELSAEHDLAGTVDYPSLLEHYRVVDKQLSTQWREYGQHAYLHHLNAVFGYQPVKVKTSVLATF